MKILTKKESERIAVALLQMQDALDYGGTVCSIYDIMTASIRDIAKACGNETEYKYTLGVTDRVYGR